MQHQQQLSESQHPKDPEPIRWRAPGGDLGIAPGALHLWRIRADDRGMDLDLCLSRLGVRQRARALRMRHVPYRERYIRAQAGLRTILGRYLDSAPESLEFQYGPAGKPYLQADGRALAFNLSTTGDLALVGLRLGARPSEEIGVDCEWIRPRVDIFAVAKRMFEPAVVARLSATPEAERLARFYRDWTALESDTKCDGRGLFRPRPEGAIRPMIRHCIPEPGYIAAIASASLPPLDAWHTHDLNAT